MADALCGPSNPLQNFQKHTTVDRTLQQDRHLVRQSPSEGFRSAARANAGALDREFEAFEAGLNPSPVPPEFQQPQNARYTGFKPLDGRPHTAGWASDFQRLQLSNTPPPIVQYRPTSRTSIQPGSQSTWQNDYLRQSPQPQRQQFAQRSMQQGYGVMTMGRLETQRQLVNDGLDIGVAESKQLRSFEDEGFDEAAFERAFDAARSQVIDQEDTLAQEYKVQSEEHTFRDDLDEQLPQSDHLLEQLRIGADTIPWQDPEQEQERLGKDDPDALARTAGQLLDSVKDDQSEKFRGSSFLALMRQLRDKEVTVHGEQLVDNSTHNEHDNPSIADAKMTGAIDVDNTTDAGRFEIKENLKTTEAA
ncbi:MAG: hypothetical protein M1835_007092 [Candelina submexicana]|nr:MAG: hypothetical protein M1835_007092 [Candelina submexicana]